MKEIKRLLAYVKNYKLRMGTAVVSMVFLTLFTVGTTGMLKPVFDDMLGGGGGKSSLIKWIEKLRLNAHLGIDGTNVHLWIPVVFVLLFVFKGLFGYFSTYLMSYIGQGVVNDLRVDLYKNIQHQPLDFFSRHPTGLLISRVISDVERIQVTLSEKLAEFIRESFKLIGLLVLIFYIDWQLSLVVLIAAPLSFYPLVRFGRKLRKVSFSSQERMADLSDILKETIVGNRVVKAFGMENFEIKRFTGAARQLFNVNMKAARIMALTSPIMEILGSVAGALLIYYFYRAINITGKMNLGDFAVFAGGAFQLYSPIKRLAKSNNYIQQAIAAATRSFEILDIEPEELDKSGSAELEDIEDSIEFRNVHFGYGGEKVLRGIDLRVERGEVVALVGASGAGKTTLVNLIPRFYDVTSGAVLIDGRDIREFSLSSLRRHIGMVGQETVLFNDSVRSNIAYGKNDVPLEDIREAAVAAYIDGFVEELPSGYDHVIGEEGGMISGGQRQRIAIARAILKNPPILILDEATSALDAESEQMVQKALYNLMEGRTVFVIAHRLSTVRNADRIVVMEKGGIIGMGRHEELMETGERYRELYELQFDTEMV